MSARGKSVVVKKYSNRRLYDTSRSAYVNLEQVAELVPLRDHRRGQHRPWVCVEHPPERAERAVRRHCTGGQAFRA